jgi:hypothetical protein
MPQINGKEVKEKILAFLNSQGPGLPVQVAKHIGLETLLASAFLSELASEKSIIISHMKVGGSPLYYTPETIAQLENFTKFLGSKEKEACILLKENKTLQDELQHPAIRVALRSIKDFAIPIKVGESIVWKYFTAKDEDIKEVEKPNTTIIEKTEEKQEEPITEEQIKQVIEQQNNEKSNEDQELIKLKQELEEKKKELERIKQEIELEQRPIAKEKPVNKKLKKILNKRIIDEAFLNEVRTNLTSKSIEIIREEQYDKKEVFLIIKRNNEEILLAAFNKRKLEDSDLLKAYKKSLLLHLNYQIWLKGEASKKTKEAIEAHKKLVSIERLSESLEQ